MAINTITLSADQIITLNDYPVHSDEVLRSYIAKCKDGEDLPFIPVIHKNLIKPHFDNTLLIILNDFEKENPQAEYFMLDGSHRTTALNICNRNITAIEYKADTDIQDAKKLVHTGTILENGTLNHTIKENADILSKHFQNKPYFMTVAQKTKKMIKENIVPK